MFRTGTYGGWSPRHILYELRGGFLLLPTAVAALIVLIGMALVGVEQNSASVAAWAARFVWTVPREAGVAQGLLATIAGAIMTVLSVVYSVLLLVLTFTSIQFSPRVIVTFMRDRINQFTLGMFLGSFTHCLATLPRVHDRNTEFIPTIAVSFAILLATGSLGCLVLFVHNMALSLQVNSIVSRIAADTLQVLADVCAPTPPITRRPVRQEGETLAVVCPRSGYIQFFDTRALVAAAERDDVAIRIHRGIGQFVTKGSAIATVEGQVRAKKRLSRRIARAIHYGPVRTLEDDVEFGLLQLVDIGLKAVSPAVNDPSTAILCVDYLGEVLAAAAGSRDPRSEIATEGGSLRLVIPTWTFARLLDIAFDQLPRYARADVAVSLRILRALSDVASCATTQAHRDAINKRAQFVHDLCVRYAPDDELAALRERLEGIRRATAPPAA